MVTVTPDITELTVHEPDLMAMIQLTIVSAPPNSAPFTLIYTTTDGTANGRLIIYNYNILAKLNNYLIASSY